MGATEATSTCDSESDMKIVVKVNGGEVVMTSDAGMVAKMALAWEAKRAKMLTKTK